MPDLHFRIRHRFRELEGRDRLLLNEGFTNFWVDTALQTIDFKLDKSGADLESEAKILCMPVPARYVFDRPFLILMRKREAKRPFLAPWVDNPELLRAVETED